MNTPTHRHIPTFCEMLDLLVRHGPLEARRRARAAYAPWNNIPVNSEPTQKRAPESATKKD
jgi:hypothetical protein